MDIIDLKPAKGTGWLRIGESDDIVISEHFSGLPAQKVKPLDHGIVVVCTSGMAQFVYDGLTVQLNKNDMFLFMAHSVVEKFMSSVDFDCREIWFSRGETWNMNMFAKCSLSDLQMLKRHPKVSLSDEDMLLFDFYLHQLSYHMRNVSRPLYTDIVHSILGSFLLEVISLLRHNVGIPATLNTLGNGGLHGKQLADRFLQLVEQCDGRIRKVDEFAKMLNVTSKYLSKLLMKTLQRKPSTMITFFTCKAIENRLRFTDMTMQQIADDLNFPNASFFGKYFKEHSGMTPMEFRTRYHHSME